MIYKILPAVGSNLYGICDACINPDSLSEIKVSMFVNYLLTICGVKHAGFPFMFSFNAND